MKFLTTREMAAKWGVSVQLIRKYTGDGRIPGAILKDGSWLIPEDAEKPGLPPREEVEITPFLKKLRYQQERNNHFGIYEYLQLNAAYSSNRMASNRLKRQQVESIYRTNRVDPGFEPVKVDDILEVINHLGAMDFVISTALEPLTSDYVKKLHYLLTYGTYADRKQYFGSGTFRTKPPRLYKDTAADPREIARKLNKLVMDYAKTNYYADLERAKLYADTGKRMK